MKDESAVALSALMLLEAFGLHVAHTETLGALIAVFATTVLTWLIGRSDRKQQ